MKHLNVIYRIDTNNNEVIAFFPTEPGTRNPNTCTIYARNGQHATASLDYYRERTKPAAPAQYAQLHQEIQRIENTHGENRLITPRQRFHHTYNQQRQSLLAGA